MSKLGDARNIANTYIDEVAANIEIRNAYSNIIVSNAGSLYAAFASDPAAKGALSEALKYKTVDVGALCKPLIVQLHGIFENYIRSVVDVVIEERFEVKDSYYDLSADFRKEHISHAARVLTNIKSGTIMGVSYNFDLLVDNLGKSFSRSSGFRLNSEIFTKLMGNCTPSRLDALFEALELPPPFSDKLGRSTLLKKYFEDRAKGRVAERARETLDDQIALRNDIVHGDLTRSVSLTELRESIEFFRALISAFHDLLEA